MIIGRNEFKTVVSGVKSKYLSMELDTLSKVADAGYFISVAHNYSGPTASFIGYPTAWVDLYTKCSYSLSDPLFLWTTNNIGIVKWSDIDLPDPKNVRSIAVEHGLNFGASASIIVSGKRSIATFSKSTSEFTDFEMHILETTLEKIHLTCFPDISLTDLELKALKFVSDGHTMVEISKIMGVSNQLIGTRMQNIRAKFGAKTNLEALAIAMRMKLIE